ncbi:two-component system sensor histidine kinase NtrB [Nitrospira sp. Nam80]
MVDEGGTILLINHQIESRFGYQRHELLGQPVEMLIPERYRIQHSDHRAGFFANPEPRQMGRGRDLYGMRKDGTEFPVEIGLNPIRTVDGLRVIASVVDITERKEIEEQLRRTERVAELGTLASGMAHEIGTPMNVILGRAEYLMNRTKDEPIKKGLETIVNQVERITRVMNQLLSFARRRTPERRAVDLKQTVEVNLEIFQERLARYRIDVEVAFEGTCPPIYADADQMSQVFINLLMNAVHAMPDGGRVHIAARCVEPDMVEWTIADTGSGIPPDVVAKIFDPFFTTKEFGVGTGLGLTVVKGIMEEHGGSISVQSELGKGSTFRLLLPRANKGADGDSE